MNVYLDGEFAFGLARIVAAWLQVGEEISDEKIVELTSTDTREVAFQQAVKFLNYRTRSEKEVRRNLQEKEFPEEIIDEVIERLQRSGLIDDKRFAQNWVENRNDFRPRSRKALKIELRQRGLKDEEIEDAIQDVDDEELAYQAGRKQSRKFKDLEWADFRLKLSNFLARRGFGYDVISTVVRRIWDENQTDGAGNSDVSSGVEGSSNY